MSESIFLNHQKLLEAYGDQVANENDSLLRFKNEIILAFNRTLGEGGRVYGCRPTGDDCWEEVRDAAVSPSFPQFLEPDRQIGFVFSGYTQNTQMFRYVITTQRVSKNEIIIRFGNWFTKTKLELPSENMDKLALKLIEIFFRWLEDPFAPNPTTMII